MRCLGSLLVGLLLVALGILAFYYFVDVIPDGSPPAEIQGTGPIDQPVNQPEAELRQADAGPAPSQPPLTGLLISPVVLAGLAIIGAIFTGIFWLAWRYYKEYRFY